MGLIDKAGDLVGTAAGRVGSTLSDLSELDLERLRVVVDVVWTNRDLLVRLPSILGDAGEQMQAAGVGAREVGGFLSGDVQALTAQAADTLEACHKPLAQVAEVLDELGARLDRLPLLGNVAEPATRGLRALGEVSTNVERVSVQLRGLSTSLQGAGAGLDAMGVSLQGGGLALATVSGRTLAQAASGATTAPAAPAMDLGRAGERTEPEDAGSSAVDPQPRTSRTRATAAGSPGEEPPRKRAPQKRSARKKATTRSPSKADTSKADTSKGAASNEPSGPEDATGG